MIINDDCMNALKTLPNASVHCCVTSPPYWWLRDYGNDNQLGIEPTPEEYVANMVSVFSEVRRVLRPDGTLWLNLGDSYGGGNGGNAKSSKQRSNRGTRKEPRRGNMPKQLVGIPWRVAFALQADGWYLRSDIIWHKPNPMPESVTDRPTKSHEYLFLMSKSAKYYYDNEAIREDAKLWNSGKMRAPKLGEHRKTNPYSKQTVKQCDIIKGANKRSVWTITTKPCREAHFATFPEDLVLPCLLAGCPEGGTVLDPFFGAGTVGVVAKKNKLNYIGIELNPDYVAIAQRRINAVHEVLF